jgi:hypothetical protein
MREPRNYSESLTSPSSGTLSYESDPGILQSSTPFSHQRPSMRGTQKFWTWL